MSEREEGTAEYGQLVLDLLLLDGMAHAYGRQSDRDRVGGLQDWWSGGDPAFVRLATVAHMMLTNRVRDERFQTVVYGTIRSLSRQAIRHHRRGRRNGPRPPIPTVALAHFRLHHDRIERPQACHPWWMGDLFNKHPDDRPPEIEPYLG